MEIEPVMHLPRLHYELAGLALRLALLVNQRLDPILFGQKRPFLWFLGGSVMVGAWYRRMAPWLLVSVLAPSSTYSLLGINRGENILSSLLLSVGALMGRLRGLLPRGKSPAQRDNQKNPKKRKNINKNAEPKGKYCQLLWENARDLVLVVRPDGQIIAANQSALKRYGYQQQELLSLKIQDISSVPNDNSLAEHVEQADRQGILFETIHRGKDGRTFPVEVSAQVWVMGNEKVVLSIIRDMTERKQTEEKLQHALQKLTFHVENSPLAVVEWDCHFRVSRWSPQAEALFGWTAAEVLGLNPLCLADVSPVFGETQNSNWQFVLTEDVAAVSDAIARLLDGREQRNISPNRNYTKNGRIVHCEWYNSALLDESGKLVSVLSLILDVTERHRTQEAERFLAEAGEVLASSLDYQTTLANMARLIVPHIADWCAVDMVDEHQTVRRLAVVHTDPSKVEWAQELQERYPPQPDDPYGVPNVLRTGHSDLYPEVPDSILVATARDAQHLAKLRQAGFTSAMVVPLIARGQTLGALTLVSAESGRRYTSSDLAFAEEIARRASLAVDNARLFASVQQELACRIQTHAALRESEERFRTMADSAPVLLWVAQPDGLRTFFNQGWLSFRGRTLAQELGNGWIEGIHPEDLSAYLHTYRTAFHARQDFEMEFRLLRADGEYRWVVDRATPRFMPKAIESFAGYIGSCTDITELKSSEKAASHRAGELAQLSAVLAQTNATLEKRNQELDQFAYIVSHDLKAPLRAIAHLSTWIEEDIQDQLSEETRHQMDLLRGRVHRMEALINGMLEYSRIGRLSAPAELVNVEKLVGAVIDSLAPPSSFTITIIGPMPTLLTQRTPLEQVLANLIGNGIKHHNRPDGRVTVSLQDKADCWEFAVADDGPGIDPRYHHKIFAIFQTLEARDKVENTGVGLAIVKKIIDNQGGTIHLESQVGRGATFSFTWPKLNTIK